MNTQNNRTILVVDDNPENLEVLKSILTRQNYTVRAANNGEIALKSIYAYPPDLILLDICMPGLTGFDVCKILKEEEKTRDIPVIFLTALADSQDIVTGFETGAVDYITKPFHSIELLKRVETHLELKNQHLILEQKVKERTKELEEKNRLLENALEEKKVLLVEVHHRVRNNLQFISGLLFLQLSEYEDEMVRELLRNYQNRIQSLTLVHAELYKSGDFINVDLVSYIKKLTRRLVSVYGYKQENIKLAINVEDFVIDINLAIPCGLILNELISNSLKHGFKETKEGKIEVALKYDGLEDYMITISHNGKQPGRDIDFERPATIGLQMINMMLEQLHGSLDVVCKEQTVFVVNFEKRDLQTYNPIECDY